MKPKPDTRNVKTAATTQPIGDTKSTPSSLRAIAATLSRPLRQTAAWTASAVPGPAGSTGTALLTGLDRGGVLVATGVAAAFTGTLRRWVCLRVLARARRLEDLLTSRHRRSGSRRRLRGSACEPAPRGRQAPPRPPPVSALHGVQRCGR